MKQLRSIKNKFANRSFFDSSKEVSGLFRSSSPSGLFLPPRQLKQQLLLPVFSIPVTERQINFYFPKDLVSHKIHQKSRKKYKKLRIVHIEMGRRPPIQKQKWRLCNGRIDCLKLSLGLGNGDLKNYWNTMCHLCQKC